MRRLAAVALAFACAACSSGGGGEDVTGSTAASPITSPRSEIIPYCEAVVDFVIVLYDAISTIDRTPADQLAATAQTYGLTLQPLGAEVLALTPEEIVADFRNLTSVIDQMAMTGDVSGFTSEPVEASTARINAFNFESCGWPIIDLVTSNRSLVNVPQQLDPGFHVFRIRNDAPRPLQVDLYLETPDRPDLSIEGLLPAGIPVAPSGVTLIASTVAQPGGAASLLANLARGEYGFVVADPAATAGPVRVFEAGTVRSFRVAESG